MVPLAITNIVLYYSSCYCSHTSIKVSSAPQGVIPLQTRHKLPYLMTTCTLQNLHTLTHTHRRRNMHKNMHMILHNPKLNNLNPPPLRRIRNPPPQHPTHTRRTTQRITILRSPCQMKTVLTHTMLIPHQLFIHHNSTPPKVF